MQLQFRFALISHRHIYSIAYQTLGRQLNLFGARGCFSPAHMHERPASEVANGHIYYCHSRIVVTYFFARIRAPDVAKSAFSNVSRSVPASCGFTISMRAQLVSARLIISSAMITEDCFLLYAARCNDSWIGFVLCDSYVSCGPTAWITFAVFTRNSISANTHTA